MHPRDWIRAQILERNWQHFSGSLSLAMSQGKTMVEDKNEHFCRRHKEALVELGTLPCIAGRTLPDVSIVIGHSA